MRRRSPGRGASASGVLSIVESCRIVAPDDAEASLLDRR